MWRSPLTLQRGRWFLMALVLTLPAVARAAQEPGMKRVLVLYSTSQDSPMATTGDRELRRILEGHLPGSMDFYAEYLDPGRFPAPEYIASFSDFLQVKYRTLGIDLLIAIQPPAVEFLNQYQREIFPGTPVVFLTYGPPKHTLANSTGVIADLDLASTLDLAVALQPETRHVFVVSGAGGPDKEYERIARAQLKPFETRFAITYLAALATEDLEARLRALPDRSIVYYLVVYQDGAGASLAPRAYSERVAEIARAPTYTWSDALMGNGVVGGSLLDRNVMMNAVGTLAVRVLRGEKPESLPVATPDLTVGQVDWRQLRRWGISERRVPSGTLVSFKELSAWDRYWAYILGAATLVAAQTVLIAGLLVQRTRRRRAEEQVRRSQSDLRASYERIRDLGGRMLGAQEAERSRIARELHDDISQQLALLMIELQGAAAHLPGQQLATMRDVLNRGLQIAQSVHDLSYRLHPAKLRLIGLVASIQALRRELPESDLDVGFWHENVPPTLPPHLELCLFRVVQEALQNAVKYSQAREVTIQLRGDSDGLRLTIADDGAGFNVDAVLGKGLGLISMGERLEAIGGTLTIHSKPGGGTRLEATVPSTAWQTPT